MPKETSSRASARRIRTWASSLRPDESSAAINCGPRLHFKRSARVIVSPGLVLALLSLASFGKNKAEREMKSHCSRVGEALTSFSSSVRRGRASERRTGAVAGSGVSNWNGSACGLEPMSAFHGSALPLAAVLVRNGPRCLSAALTR